MIERVLQNLIENALKYTPTGGQVVLELERTNSKIQVRVTDTGCGISPADQANIFDRYYRSRDNRNRGDGAGLGLAIVRKILTLHGEKISVESQENVRTTFSFHLS